MGSSIYASRPYPPAYSLAHFLGGSTCQLCLTAHSPLSISLYFVIASLSRQLNTLFLHVQNDFNPRLACLVAMYNLQMLLPAAVSGPIKDQNIQQQQQQLYSHASILDRTFFTGNLHQSRFAKPNACLTYYEILTFMGESSKEIVLIENLSSNNTGIKQQYIYMMKGS
jgi:hypothetical protein